MTKTRRRTALCANTRLSDDLTQDLVLRLSQLTESPKRDYLLKVILSKFVSKDTDPPELRKGRAIAKWLDTEANNEQTNDRLIMADGAGEILPRVSLDEFVAKCRDVIANVIGETVPIEALIGSFSGGSSTSRKRTKSHPALKYVGELHATARAKVIWDELVIPEIQGWASGGDFHVKVVPANMMFTVPKKADIDRVACKEPDVNMFIQKGLGNQIRKCLLRKAGINLNDQSINWKLARVGSITNELATLDLSSASDSVTRELVFLMLPVSWFTFLDAVRCHDTAITSFEGDGTVFEHSNHMFSSMGNGFTFELESLLFWALARTVQHFMKARGSISVYGDDIICPVQMYHELVTVLNFFGFSVNPDKSFSDGPFRESCGGHFYNGSDITPFYIREPITSLIQVMHVANSLRAWADFKVGMPILDPEVGPIWGWLKAFVPDGLWGGDNLSFKYQLVSHNDTSSYRLREETEKKDTGLGGFYHWLNLTHARENVTIAQAIQQTPEHMQWLVELWAEDELHEGTKCSRRSIALGKFRQVFFGANRAKTRLDCYFWEEEHGDGFPQG